jgi:hypothetical protein
LTGLPLADQLDFVHSLWVEWRQEWVQTKAQLALAGIVEDVEADPHVVFDEVFEPPPDPAARGRRTAQEIEARHALIAQLAGQ